MDYGAQHVVCFSVLGDVVISVNENGSCCKNEEGNFCVVIATEFCVDSGVFFGHEGAAYYFASVFLIFLRGEDSVEGYLL